MCKYGLISIRDPQITPYSCSNPPTSILVLLQHFTGEIVVFLGIKWTFADACDLLFFEITRNLADRGFQMDFRNYLQTVIINGSECKSISRNNDFCSRDMLGQYAVVCNIHVALLAGRRNLIILVCSTYKTVSIWAWPGTNCRTGCGQESS